MKNLRMELLPTKAKNAEERMAELSSGTYREIHGITLGDLLVGITSWYGFKHYNAATKGRAPEEVCDYKYKPSDCVFRSFPDGFEVLSIIAGSGEAIAYLVRNIEKENVTLEYQWNPAEESKE